MFPLRVEGQLVPGEEHPLVSPTVPIFDACAYLSYLAARTERIGLAQIARLRALAERAGRHPMAIEATVMGEVTGLADVEQWVEAGVDRLIVTPWRRSRDAVDGLERLAHFLWG